MQHSRSLLLSVCLVAAASVAHAEKEVVDCSQESLADALGKIKGREAIQFTGVCAGPIVIRTDGVTLSGVGTAVVDGAGQDAITIVGASDVTLSDFEVRPASSAHNGQGGVYGRIGDRDVFRPSITRRGETPRRG